LPGERVEAVVCDINGERYRSEEWGFTMLRLPETFVDPTAYDAPASCWGDMGAASGPLFVAVAVTAAKRGWAKGTRYLIWNSSEQGHRAAVVLEFTLQ
jgi:3-oxoacyl-[acyl-carrier-protein] synthase-1